ncbi:hypothetical protein JZ751_005724 [Albula glossodonta]|uniref:Uncharacterized protein n=1 Tax=Albula glossodonta TaxID=121402 RepID=A0A8T2N3N4_9TELE|nr:hypothetical protein JZ751_005724 [Albula glossodonta]
MEKSRFWPGNEYGSHLVADLMELWRRPPRVVDDSHDLNPPQHVWVQHAVNQVLAFALHGLWWEVVAVLLLNLEHLR